MVEDGGHYTKSLGFKASSQPWVVPISLSKLLYT